MWAELWRAFGEGFKDSFKAIGAWFWRLLRRMGVGLTMVPRDLWVRVAAGVPVVFLIYSLLGMAVVHRMDTRYPAVAQVAANDSAAVHMVRSLIIREAQDHGWTANDPFFLPGYWLDNLPNFQRGIMGALSRFTFELRDQLGRRRGSSASDADLERAAGNLSREPDRWIIDLSASWLPTRPADAFYREAAIDLDSYLTRLAAGDAIYDRRADNLLATLDRIALDLGASSAALDDYIAGNAGGLLPDFGVDNLFYQVKGQVYAYSALLQALRVDFAKVIDERDLSPLFDQLLQSLDRAAQLDPLIVTNGAMDGFWANHLSIQGFYLLRARTQLREVTQILLA